MNVQWIWETILIFAVGTLVLRIGGRRSISEMTIPETVITISLGALLVQPLSGKGLWTTFGIAFVMILTLIVMEYIQFKWDPLENAISGKSVVVIENGELNIKNMKKLRLTTDNLEARLRQEGIASIADLQWATIEVSGQLGYQLKPEKQPATKEDLERIVRLLEAIHPEGAKAQQTTNPSLGNNIFAEIKGGHHVPPPEQLQ